jgi:hypothetical protein
MIQARKNAAFALEPRLFACVDTWERDDFQRNRSPSDLIVRSVHDAHPPAADLALDDEAPR